MEKLLKWNAEFAKNVWLEMSMQRIIAMPAVIALLLVFVVNVYGGNTSMEDEEKLWSLIHYYALIGFIMIGLMWGMKNAADSILDEFNEKTWDWQKMSTIGPWKLSFGKLFGSTIYNWYGAILCWLIYMFSSLQMAHPENEFKFGILLLLAMVALPGLMILISLQIVGKNNNRNKIKSNSVFIIGLILLLFLFQFFGASLAFGKGTFSNGWYNNGMLPRDAMVLIAVFYSFWIICGLYRSMRAELQYSDTPVWWFAFIFSNFVFQSGFFVSIPEYSFIEGILVSCVFAFIELLIMIYFLSFTEAKDIVNFRQLFVTAQKGELNNFFQNIPLWLVSIPAAFFIGLVAILIFAIVPTNADLFDSLALNGKYDLFKLLNIWLSLFGFVIRDMGILLVLNFSVRTKRADLAMFIYLVLLYFVLPKIITGTGIAAAFYPDLQNGSFFTCLFPLAEAALVLFFLNQRWKEINALNNLVQD